MGFCDISSPLRELGTCINNNNAFAKVLRVSRDQCCYYKGRAASDA